MEFICEAKFSNNKYGSRPFRFAELQHIRQHCCFPATLYNGTEATRTFKFPGWYDGSATDAPSINSYGTLPDYGETAATSDNPERATKPVTYYAHWEVAIDGSGGSCGEEGSGDGKIKDFAGRGDVWKRERFSPERRNGVVWILRQRDWELRRLGGTQPPVSSPVYIPERCLPLRILF